MHTLHRNRVKGDVDCGRTPLAITECQGLGEIRLVSSQELFKCIVHVRLFWCQNQYGHTVIVADFVKIGNKVHVNLVEDRCISLDVHSVSDACVGCKVSYGVLYPVRLNVVAIQWVRSCQKLSHCAAL